MIINDDLDLVKNILGKDDWECDDRINCGDLKLLYSYNNRDSSSELGYSYAGRNYNTISDFLLN